MLGLKLKLQIFPPYFLMHALEAVLRSVSHEIVRAQNKVSKGRPKTRPKPHSVITDPQV